MNLAAISKKETPAPIASTSEHMRLVAKVLSVIKARRQPCYSSLEITDAQADELARAIATRMIVAYRMTETEED